MCKHKILLAYKRFASETSTKIPALEECLLRANIVGFDDDLASLWMNETYIYTAIFSNECRHEVEELFRRTLREMHGIPISDSAEKILLLAFIQDLGAKGLWKFHLDIGDILDSFVREFDRLDVPSEQVRLHAWAQTKPV